MAEKIKRWMHVNGDKRCTKCGEWLPADKVFFYGDKNEKDGLRRICKGCYSETPCIVRRNEQRQQKGSIHGA